MISPYNYCKKQLYRLLNRRDRYLIEKRPLARVRNWVKVKEGEHIPKIIHQTYASHTVPDEIARNIKRIKELNPGWEYRLYDDQDIITFISAHFTEYLPYYNRISPKYGAVKADFFRYLLLYFYGGVYLDIKSSMKRPLDEIIQKDDKYLLSHWYNLPGGTQCKWGVYSEIDNPRGEFQQWFIVSTSGHPFLYEVIINMIKQFNMYKPKKRTVGKKGVLQLSGPIMYTHSILPVLNKHSFRMIESEQDSGFIYNIFKNESHCQKLFKHHYKYQRRSILLADK